MDTFGHGNGPGIVVVHGGGVTADLYRRLAERLADRFTVHLYNRRGRPGAPPRIEPYTVEQDVDDLAGILSRTGSSYVLGHSGGGFVALNAALRLPIEKLALYDPAVSINGHLNTAWVDEARRLAAAGDTARALTVTAAGLNTHSPVSSWPFGVRLAITRIFLRTLIGRMMGPLIASALDETQQIRLADGPPERWSGVTADTLLTCGASGPRYYIEDNALLARALPRARALVIPRCGHDALNRAPRRLVEPLAEFFAA